jgi:S-formylglutathione hydrolase FrmB
VSDAPAGASGGRVVAFTVNGKASGISLRAFAYLPPGYDDEPLSGQRLPVIEALAGFPGSPSTWLKALEAPRILDEEITSGRMAPTVVVFPYQVLSNAHDTECVNEVGGIQMDTFLTTDVPEAVTRLFRVRTDAAGWGLIGYSAGAFCAVNLTLRHPDRYSAAASLSGYFRALTDKTTGDLYKGNIDARNQNSPLWRVQNLPLPRVALYLAAAKDDAFEYRELQQFVAATHSPLRVTTQSLPQGGHTRKVWKALAAPAFDWLSSWLAGPVAMS